jgi:hypothetical protein
MCAWCLGLLECCAFLGSCLLFLSILTLSSLFPWNKVGHVYIKVQQQTTWDEIPEKTNSSSSVTKNTLCSFIKILRAPNPKPGVHWSLNNQVGTYIEARMMQHCSSVFHVLPNEVKKKKKKKKMKLHKLRFGKILFKTNSAKIKFLLLRFLCPSWLTHMQDCWSLGPLPH